MWLNCKVIKKWQPPISTSTPPFQVYPPFLVKNFVPHKWLNFWKFLPPFKKGGGWGSDYVIFINYFNTGTISVKEWSSNVIISVFSRKQQLPISNCNKLEELGKGLFLTHSTTYYYCRKLLKNYHLLCKFWENKSCHQTTYIKIQIKISLYKYQKFQLFECNASP